MRPPIQWGNLFVQKPLMRISLVLRGGTEWGMACHKSYGSSVGFMVNNRSRFQPRLNFYPKPTYGAATQSHLRGEGWVEARRFRILDVVQGRACEPDDLYELAKADDFVVNESVHVHSSKRLQTDRKLACGQTFIARSSTPSANHFDRGTEQ